MIATVNSSVIKGSITVPASKSAMQRACALALLNNGDTIIKNPGSSNDDFAAIGIITDLGALIVNDNNNLVISSTGNILSNGSIHCGESGLSFRMFSPLAALSDSTIVINGSGSLLKRPMHLIEKLLPLLNVNVTSENGFLPVIITGPLRPENITIDGSSSSQYLTGFLFAFAAAAKNPVTITVENLKSKPYIDLSLQMLAHFGYKVSHDAYKQFEILPAEKKVRHILYHTESDWSSAAFLLVAAAIAGEVSLTGTDMNSVQADKAIVDILQKANADVIVSGKNISVTNAGHLKAFEFDATDCPDLFPPLTVLASCCNGISRIKGISRLSEKESNRTETLMEAFSKMGVEIKLQDDSMLITGGTGFAGAEVSSHHDHRIAMACAIAGLRANGPVIINHAEAVKKSYPAFFDHLKKLGAAVFLEDQKSQ